MIRKKLSLLENCLVEGDFHPDSYLECSQELMINLQGKKSILHVQRMNANKGSRLPLLKLSIGNFTGKIRVLTGSDGQVSIGYCGQLNLDVRIGRDGCLTIGNGTTCNGAMCVAVAAKIRIGEDCMLSDGILIQGGDQHAIFNVNDFAILNNKKMIDIGRHVWLGRGASLMPGAIVGDGSIIGSKSVVTKEIPNLSLAVGSPAKIIKTGVSWGRAEFHVDETTKEMVMDIAKHTLE